MEIGKLFAAIGASIQQAQEFLSQKDVERYMGYFQSADEDASSDENGKAALYPKAIRFSLQGKEKNGYVDVPMGPGLGIEIDDEAIERYRCDMF